MAHTNQEAALELTKGTQYPCKQCGAKLQFSIADKQLKCDHCDGLQNVLLQTKIDQKHDYQDFRIKLQASERRSFENIKELHQNCISCGKSTNINPQTLSYTCEYCDTAIVLKDRHAHSLLKTDSIIVFKIQKTEAEVLTKKWLKNRWFVPNNFKTNVLNGDLDGEYSPAWLFDAKSQSYYTGQRGTYYYDTVRDSNGNTRRVRHTSWSSVTGQVSAEMRNILTGNALSKLNQKLSFWGNSTAWPFAERIEFNDQVLSGFESAYKTDGLDDGFREAEAEIEYHMRYLAQRDIGGDEQRISTINTQISDVKFEQTMLPFWVFHYRYNHKEYPLVMNGVSGQITGERPYSAWKIFFFIIAILLFITMVYGLLVFGPNITAELENLLNSYGYTFG